MLHVVCIPQAIFSAVLRCSSVSCKNNSGPPTLSEYCGPLYLFSGIRYLIETIIALDVEFTRPGYQTLHVQRSVFLFFFFAQGLREPHRIAGNSFLHKILVLTFHATSLRLCADKTKLWVFPCIWMNSFDLHQFMSCVNWWFCHHQMLLLFACFSFD